MKHRAPTGPRKPLDHLHPLVRFLFEEMARQDISWTDMEDYGFIPRTTLSTWRSGYCGPSLACLEAALDGLGFELVARRKGH